MPASSVAFTTAVTPSASNRRPKLLQPTPTTETLNEPICRVSISPVPLKGTNALSGKVYPVRNSCAYLHERTRCTGTGGHLRYNQSQRLQSGNSIPHATDRHTHNAFQPSSMGEPAPAGTLQVPDQRPAQRFHSRLLWLDL